MQKTPLPITAEELIHHFTLEAHPEGGFYKRTYQSNQMIPQSALPPEFLGDRYFSTAIYYLLLQDQKSKLHRIKSDELWHFYLGGPLTLVGIDKRGAPYEVTLGQDIQAGQKLQHAVPAGHWFAATPTVGSEFSFVGCTVAPGFDFAEFEMGKRDQLLLQYPQASELISNFT